MRFGGDLSLETEHFEELVARAVESLPENLIESLDNLDILVQDWPTRQQLDEVDIKHRQELLGLYEGVPLTHRGSGYNLVLPDRITIFQKSIEMLCSSDIEIIERVRRTVLHELAHYFGISDHRLREIGRY